MPLVLSRVITDGFIPSVMFPQENVFLRTRILLYYRRCFRRWVVFFICDRISDENGIYRQLLYRRKCSVGESVGIIFTDGMKLDNVVVIFLITLFMNSWLIRILCHMQWILILNEIAMKYSFAWTGYNIQVKRHQTVSYLPCHRQDLKSRPLPTPLIDKNISSI